MSDGSDDDEFQPNKNYLSKDQQTYGVFTEAYDERPSFARGPSKRNKPTAGFVNFKSGEKIQSYSDKVEVTLLEPSKKKKVVFDDKPVVFEEKPAPKTIETGEQQVFTLESLLSTLNNNQQAQSEDMVCKEPEVQMEEELQKGFTARTRSILKLRRYGEYKQYSLSDYGLPESFGKKQDKPKKEMKSSEQVQKEMYFSSKYGVGYKMLAKVGFNALKGLGKDEHGMLEPIQSVNKQTLTAEDDSEPLVIEEEEEMVQEVIEEEKEDRSMLELFDYFSEDPSINSVLRELRMQFESLESKVMRQEETLERLQMEMEVAESERIQYQALLTQQKQKVCQLLQLKDNIYDSHPHLALKFNIDLLIVKSAIERIQAQKTEDLLNWRSIFREIKGASKRLEKIYLEKEKETIKEFSLNNLKNFIHMKSSNESLNDVVSISTEDIDRIKRFEKLIFDETVSKSFLKLLQNLQLSDDTSVNTAIEILEVLGKMDKPLQQKYLDRYIYPLLNHYLKMYKPSAILPHMVVFPWLIVISPSRLNFKDFVFNLQKLELNSEDTLLLSIVIPWRKYMDEISWSNIISFSVAPRLLSLLKDFVVSASSQNSKNLNKLKCLMKYAEVLSTEQAEAIIEDTILPAIGRTFLELKQSQTSQRVTKWVENWSGTLGKIKADLDFREFFKSLDLH